MADEHVLECALQHFDVNGLGEVGHETRRVAVSFTSASMPYPVRAIPVTSYLSFSFRDQDETIYMSGSPMSDSANCQIKAHMRRDLERLRSGAHGGDRIAATVQQQNQGGARGRVVFHQQDPLCCGRLGRPPPQ